MDDLDKQERFGTVIVGSAAERLQKTLVAVSSVSYSQQLVTILIPCSMILGSKAASSDLRLDVELVLRFLDKRSG